MYIKITSDIFTLWGLGFFWPESTQDISCNLWQSKPSPKNCSYSLLRLCKHHQAFASFPSKERNSQFKQLVNSTLPKKNSFYSLAVGREEAQLNVRGIWFNEVYLKQMEPVISSLLLSGQRRREQLEEKRNYPRVFWYTLSSLCFSTTTIWFNLPLWLDSWEHSGRFPVWFTLVLCFAELPTVHGYIHWKGQ